jgi:DNA-binding response OmpR family regulator
MRILVVEDEPRITGDVRSALTGAGYVVDIANDGEDA